MKINKLNESMKGFIRTYCDACGKMNRVEVEFKEFNKPFEDTTFTCSNCGAKNLLTDPHEYNDDGTIKESVKLTEESFEFGEDTEESDDLISAEQEFDSAATSINSNKLPAVYSMVRFNPGDVVVDFGGGKFDNAVNYLKDQNVTLLVYDPYNRSAEHNKEVLKVLKERGGADAAINSNVLNVIKEPEARNAVLQNIKKITKKGAPIYITVYEGTGKGNEGPTKSGYQLNRKTANYMDEINQVFSNVKRRGRLITAINESINEDSDNEIPYTREQVEDDIRRLTKNFTVSDDVLKCGYKEEAEYSEEILSKYYASVEIDKVGSWFQVEFKDRLKEVDESVNPAELTYCPACGDTSFDSKRGRCTKCFYRESLHEAYYGGEYADEWYANVYPDDEVGIEQLNGILMDDILKNRKIIDHCDTQVRDRVYAQLDKDAHSSKKSPIHKKVNEAFYGGAYDIEDDQYFTRDDLNEFGEDVVDTLNSLSYSKFEYAGSYIDDGILELTVTWNENEVTAKAKIDMRKIRKPSDLFKAYSGIMIDQLKNEFEELGADFGPHLRDQDYPLDENIDNEFNEDDQVDIKFMNLEKIPSSLNDEIAKNLEKYFRDNSLYVSEMYYNPVRDMIEFDINWGDWKHEHLRAQILIKEFFEGLGSTIDIKSWVTEEDGSDTYSAHYQLLVIE